MKKTIILVALAVLVSWGTSLAKVIDTETQPNVIFILADDWGYGSLPPIQLYDMEADIGEINNLVAEYPEIVTELKDLLTEIVRNGRSTPGPKLANTGPKYWSQLNWLTPENL